MHSSGHLKKYDSGSSLPRIYGMSTWLASRRRGNHPGTKRVVGKFPGGGVPRATTGGTFSKSEMLKEKHQESSQKRNQQGES